jgi:glutamyl-tRNA synthetase
MAPSPTGEMHVGSLATLLKNYAFAKKHGGKFILRIEDTDQNREVEGAAGRILSVIKAYGLDWDEGPDIGGPYAPYTQSERLDRYKEVALELVKNGWAYHCFCTPERLEQVNLELKAQKKPPMYDRHCRNLSPDQMKAKLDSGAANV